MGTNTNMSVTGQNTTGIGNVQNTQQTQEQTGIKEKLLSIFQTRKEQFDTNKNGIMDAGEEAAVMEFAKEQERIEQNCKILDEHTTKGRNQLDAGQYIPNGGKSEKEKFQKACINAEIDYNDADTMKIMRAGGALSKINLLNKDYANNRAIELLDYTQKELIGTSDDFAKNTKTSLGSAGIELAVLYTHGKSPDGRTYKEIMQELRSMSAKQIEEKYGASYTTVVNEYITKPLINDYKEYMDKKIPKNGNGQSLRHQAANFTGGNHAYSFTEVAFEAKYSDETIQHLNIDINPNMSEKGSFNA